MNDARTACHTVMKRVLDGPCGNEGVRRLVYEMGGCNHEPRCGSENHRTVEDDTEGAAVAAPEMASAVVTAAADDGGAPADVPVLTPVRVGVSDVEGTVEQSRQVQAGWLSLKYRKVETGTQGMNAFFLLRQKVGDENPLYV